MNGTKVIFAVLLTSWMSSTMAAETANQNSSGTIRFQGAIIEPPCEMNQQHNQVSAACYRDGVRQTSVVSLHGRQALPTGIGSTEVQWLDASRTQGIMTVSYK